MLRTEDLIQSEKHIAWSGTLCVYVEHSDCVATKQTGLCLLSDSLPFVDGILLSSMF